LDQYDTVFWLQYLILSWEDNVLTAELYSNGDDCFLAWAMPFTKGCRGFAIYREVKRKSNGKTYSEYLSNPLGFRETDGKPGKGGPSDKFPFRRYNWTDYGVSEGDKVSYTIYPVMKTAQGLKVDQTAGIKKGPVTVTSDGDGQGSAYFNRGILLSQFVSKRLPKNFTKSDLTKFKKSLENGEDQFRRFLSGPLGAKLLELLDEAKKKGWYVYAALYELEDAQLIGRLKALGAKANLVLANGSTKKKGEDGNKVAAGELEHDINLYRRMLWSEGLGHNKFVVFCDSSKKPFMVWTGSTNWATTGLCTQLNNGILVNNIALATVYLEQWNLLKDDQRVGKNGTKMHFGSALMAANDKAKDGTAGVVKRPWTVWFTRTSSKQEMKAVTDLVNGAQDGILFLMFEPGTKGLLQVIQSRMDEKPSAGKKKLYIHGVVNTLKTAEKGQDLHVNVVGGGKPKPFDLSVVQPEGVPGGLAGWAAEVGRREFLMTQGGVIGYAIVHSKVIVIDPFSNPIVITGSHNFSESASQKNDENLLILKGDKGLAERYAVNIMGVYQHYRWRAYLQDDKNKKKPWKKLANPDDWQNKDAASDPELAFWL
jgi:hypothetical protein